MTNGDLLRFVKAAVRPDPATLLDALLSFSGAERGFLVLRQEDIPLLGARFLERIARETGQPRKNLSKQALAILVDHSWPGNVRELENSLRRAAALTEREVLEASDFSFKDLGPRMDGEGDRPIIAIEEYIRSVLVQWGDRLELR